MNTEDSEFERIEREAMRCVPDAIHHTDLGETLEYITGWNDCRAAMLEQHQGAEHMSKELLQMVFEAMSYGNTQDRESARLAVGAALADQPAQQEPVAIALNTGTKQGVKWLKNVEHGEHLYTFPQAQRKPLTVAVEFFDEIKAEAVRIRVRIEEVI